MNRANLYLAGLLVAASCVHLSAAIDEEELSSPETESYATQIILADEEREQPISFIKPFSKERGLNSCL